MNTYIWPDGTKSSNEPADGQIWVKFCPTTNKTLEVWQYDGFKQQWFNVSSLQPQHSSGGPIVLENIDMSKHEWTKYSDTGFNVPPKCDCGSEAVGSPRHSSYCSKYHPEQ